MTLPTTPKTSSLSKLENFIALMSCHLDKDRGFCYFYLVKTLKGDDTQRFFKFKVISCPQPVKSPPWDMGKGYIIPKVNFVSLK